MNGRMLGCPSQSSFVLCFTLLLSIQAQALKIDNSLPDYTKSFGNGEYILAMLSTPNDPKYPGGGNSAHRWDESIRAVYPHAGLYTSGEHPKLLWKIDWYAHANQVYVDSDGLHAARWRRPTDYVYVEAESAWQDRSQDLYIDFYKNGVLLETRHFFGDFYAYSKGNGFLTVKGANPKKQITFNIKTRGVIKPNFLGLTSLGVGFIRFVLSVNRSQ